VHLVYFAGIVGSLLSPECDHLPQAWLWNGHFLRLETSLARDIFELVLEHLFSDLYQGLAELVSSCTISSATPVEVVN